MGNANSDTNVVLLTNMTERQLALYLSLCNTYEQSLSLVKVLSSLSINKYTNKK